MAALSDLVRDIKESLGGFKKTRDEVMVIEDAFAILLTTSFHRPNCLADVKAVVGNFYPSTHDVHYRVYTSVSEEKHYLDFGAGEKKYVLHFKDDAGK